MLVRRDVDAIATLRLQIMENGIVHSGPIDRTGLRIVHAVPIRDLPFTAREVQIVATRHTSDVITARALEDDSFNDAQHRRVAAKVTDAFWVREDHRCIETVLSRANAPDTRALLIERLQEILSQSLSAVEQTEISSRLIAPLPSLAGNELETVAQAIRTLGGKGALETADDVLDELDNDQRHTLRGVFPSSKLLADVDSS